MRDSKGRFIKGHKLGKRFQSGHKPWNKGTNIQTNTGRTHFTSERVRGASNNRWKGGRKIDGYGYVHILSPQHPFASNTGYVKEHRLAMEQHLGRYLERHEVVHHLNKVKDDNRIENLELLGSHSVHMQKHHQHILDYPGGKPHIK